MKRFLWAFLFICAILGVVLFFVRSNSGSRSIYYVPENAALIIESKDPASAWNKIIKSSVWNHFRRNDFFNEINSDVHYFDSLIQSNKLLLKLMGEKPLMISQHLVSNSKYDFLFILDVGKLGKLKNPEKALGTILGKNFEVTSRQYKAQKIVELYDKENKEFSFLCLTEGKILFSFDATLVPASIDAFEKMQIGSNSEYLAVKSKTGSKGLFSITIVHENFKQILENLSPAARLNFENNTRGMAFTSMIFELSNTGLITVEGFSSFNEASEFNYLTVLENGSAEFKSKEIIPARIASLAKVNFTDAAQYFMNSMRAFGEKDYKEYTSNLSRIEERLNIDLNKNLFSWMKEEIVFVQTQPSNLGIKNEFAILLNSSDSAIAAENLQIVWKQIRKNTPIKIKNVNYKGYQIDYIGFSGILKMLFGKVIKKIEKPYFCVIGNQVVVSNHPQTIKNIIDNYLLGNTLARSEKFAEFEGLFDTKTAAVIHVDPPVLFHNLKDIVNSKSWAKLNANKEYYACFEQGRIQLENTGSLLHFDFKLQYKTEVEPWSKQFYNTSDIESKFIYIHSVKPEDSKIIKSDTIPQLAIPDLDARKFEEFYKNGKLKLSVELKEGLKHGSFRSYFGNGQVRISGEFKHDQPTGKWKYYDSEGNLLKTDKY